MTLNEEERDSIVLYRMQKAKNTLSETKDIVSVGSWYAAANRLYYACYYAVSALLIKNGHEAHTHSGVIGQLGQFFVQTNIISKEQNQLYRRLFELRQGGDYSDWIIIEEKDILPLVEPVEQFIQIIEKLIATK
ncbi:DNA-binding protein [Bacteroidia bacterium]|nr:DNA-binding protein [Bacteroidia bacterium]